MSTSCIATATGCRSEPDAACRRPAKSRARRAAHRGRSRCGDTACAATDMNAPAPSLTAAAPSIGARNYAIVTAAYWAFTLTDGALRMLVLLHFNQLGYSPV